MFYGYNINVLENVVKCSGNVAVTFFGNVAVTFFGNVLKRFGALSASLHLILLQHFYKTLL